MQSHFPPSAAATPRNNGFWDLAEACLQQTAGAVHEAGAATPAEINQAVNAAREFHAKEKPADLLDLLARIQGHGEEHVGKAITDLADKVALTLSPYAPLIPFAAKLIAPSAFYDAFDHIHKTARALLSPVIYAEDTDSIGIASINPVACMLLSEEIQQNVYKRFGIRPFITIARMDYESWSFLTRKHFEL